MDGARRQIAGPALLELRELLPELLRETCFDFMGPRRAGLEERPPTRDREIVWPAYGKTRTRKMQLCECAADARAVERQDASWP